MRLNPRQKAILLGILSDGEHFAQLTPRYVGNHEERCVLANERQRIQDAIAGLVQTNPSVWLGEAMTPTLYVLVSRDYKRLESLKLIERHALGYDERRTTHLRITDEGRAMVDRLRLEAVDG